MGINCGVNPALSPTTTARGSRQGLGQPRVMLHAVKCSDVRTFLDKANHQGEDMDPLGGAGYNKGVTINATYTLLSHGKEATK
jgi:hypothetical protein